MDIARSQATGAPIAGRYMTCFHELEPRNGTCWMGNCPPVEPCDDILPDGLFTAGTTVFYFFEARDAASGAVVGTFPFRSDGGPITTAQVYGSYWLQINNLPALNPICNGTYANDILLIDDFQTAGVPAGLGKVHRNRLTEILGGYLDLGVDVYDVVGTDWHHCYDGIGRREDRVTQQPRPPLNGATNLMLSNYDCSIWYSGGLLDSDVMLSDQRTLSVFGGQPSMDQQKLETWLAGCNTFPSRLLVLEGSDWASAIDAGTTNGPAFLSNRGVYVLASDYEQLSGDQRRCARITSSRPADLFDHGEIFGSGCQEVLGVNVFGGATGGEAVAMFMNSFERAGDPSPDCPDDQTMPTWLAVVRKEAPADTCRKSAAMSFALADLYETNCAYECAPFAPPQPNLVVDLLQWAVCIPREGIQAAEAPRFVNALYPARPNPANPRAEISYAIAQKGHVSLKIFDVSGRLVRTLVDRVQEPATTPYVVVWDGTNDGGQRVGSGVFFYQVSAPGFGSSKKLVILR
jgi:hypothetical protein